jgi:hypothetical protein
VTVDGEDASDSDSDDSLTAHNLGAGFTFYTRSNWYIGAQTGLSFLTITDVSQGESDTIGPGIAAGGIFGKEWFVTNELGIGFAAQFTFLHVTDDDTLNGDDVGWTGFSTGPMFSLTFN